MKLALVLDFDGTITTRDIGVEIIKNFADPGWEEGLRRWRAGEIGQSQLMEWEFARLPAGRAMEMRQWALREAEVRPGLAGLMELCRANGVKVEVVSNGMSFYVEAVLEREGLSSLPFVAPIPTLSSVTASPPASAPGCASAKGFSGCDRVGGRSCSSGTAFPTSASRKRRTSSLRARR